MADTNGKQESGSSKALSYFSFALSALSVYLVLTKGPDLIGKMGYVEGRLHDFESTVESISKAKATIDKMNSEQIPALQKSYSDADSTIKALFIIKEKDPTLVARVQGIIDLLQDPKHKDAATALTDAANHIVPLGAVIPFFGNNLPRGYRWCNGTSSDPTNVYPKADWVPKHLVGQALPDMDKWLLGGTNDVTSVGLMWAEGKFSIEGNSFSLADEKLVDADYLTNGDVRLHALGYWNGKSLENVGSKEMIIFDAPLNKAVTHFKTLEVQTKAYRYDKKLSGSATVKFDTPTTNPRHIMCRWIMRVE